MVGARTHRHTQSEGENGVVLSRNQAERGVNSTTTACSGQHPNSPLDPFVVAAITISPQSVVFYKGSVRNDKAFVSLKCIVCF